ATDTAQVTVDIEPGDNPPPMIDACVGGVTPITQGTIEAGVPTCIGNDGDNWTSFSFSGADDFRSAAITLAHGDGDPSLYVRKNSWPTQTEFDASSTNPGSYECVYLRQLTDYWNYLAVKDASTNGMTITVDYNTSGCRAVGANVDPTASFTAPSSAEVGEAVSFDASSSNDTDGTIVAYAWDFGDGQTGTGSNPTHTFASAGNFAVTLTVTDNRDGTATTTQSINITAVINDPPTANANGPYTVNLGDTLIFDSTGSSDPEGNPLTYTWDFGDGSAGTGASPSHTYAAVGSYNVGLTVTDDGGLTASSSATVTVSEPPPPSYCSSQGGGTYEWISNVSVGNFSNSSGSSSGYTDFTAQTITLNEGDNSISLTAGGGYTEHWKVWFDFNRDGDFEDVGEVVLSGLSGKDTVTGNINISATANFVQTRMRIAMKYSSEASSPCGDFGDGETEDYTVNLVTNGGGTNQDPTANANGPYAALTGEAINFSSAGSSDTDGTIDSYSWDFGDGSTSASADPTHTYSTANNYTVTLTVTDNQGATATSSTTATITEDTGGNQPVYCDASGGGSYEWIANVATGSFSNPSGAAPYTDYTGQTIGLETGSNNIALTAGGGYTESWKIWIDYNVDGDFDDAGETVLSGLSGKDTVNGNINIPTSADGTTTRMRVAMKYNGEPSSSCGDFGDGEVEDYTVSITQNSSNPPGGGTCGATTNDGGALLFDQVECVNRSSAGKYSYYIYVENDATQMYITTSGGTGDVDIYYNADTWAGSDNYQYSSTLVGNEQTLAVTANKGYRYISLETDTEFADVNLVVSLTAPTGNTGEDNTDIGQGGSGTTDANDPDCQLADTPTNDPAINMYTFESSNNVTENYFEGWVRVRGTSVNSNYQLKFCPATYGSIRLGNRSETLDANHYGKEFEYNYKHWGTRATNVESIKTIATAEDGSKAVMTVQLQLQNPTVEHPVQPSCDDLTLDADFDGIPDCAEEPGKTFYTMPLYDWGARKNQLDIFIEVDWMDKHPLKDYDGNYVYDDNGNQIIDHGTEPKRKVLDIVKEVYAARGIYVHFDIGDKFDQAPGLDPADYDLGGGQAIPFMEYIHLARWTDNYNGRIIEVPGMDEDVMPQYFFNNPERDKIFYYVLFANSQGGA
ncbi:MAG: PKD domain-containing protein, partial [Kangiellaceae bacterium]|nr:PKD domain-containing protein [Kangiellaceae bacterium]